MNKRFIRILTFCLLTLSWLTSLSQDQGYTDYRRKTESFSRLYDKGIRSDMASFAIGGIEESLGKAPLPRLPITRYGSDYIGFDSGVTHITIHGAPFVVGKHKMQYENKHLVRIDNRPYYGDYGRVPQMMISAVTVLIGKDTVAIPASAFADLYHPGFTYNDPAAGLMSQDAVFLSQDKRTMYIYMLNRDDTGSYEVTWIIQDKKFLKRVLDWGFSK